MRAGVQFALMPRTACACQDVGMRLQAVSSCDSAQRMREPRGCPMGGAHGCRTCVRAHTRSYSFSRNPSQPLQFELVGGAPPACACYSNVAVQVRWRHPPVCACHSRVCGGAPPIAVGHSHALSAARIKQGTVFNSRRAPSPLSIQSLVTRPNSCAYTVGETSPWRLAALRALAACRLRCSWRRAAAPYILAACCRSVSLGGTPPS